MGGGRFLRELSGIHWQEHCYLSNFLINFTAIK